MSSHDPGTSSQLINHEEDEMILKKGYVVMNKVGEGSYAKVRKAFSKNLKVDVAIKIVDLSEARQDFRDKFFPREILIMTKLKHNNIIKMYEHFSVGIKTMLVLELATHGDLLDYIKARRRLSDRLSQHLFRQLCEGVSHMHSMRIIHRDLKCENILLDQFDNIKLTDFGFARYLLPGEESRTFCGSAAYAAPEILNGETYKGFYYDIWSLGIILYIMLTGKMPFDDNNLDDLVKAQRERNYDYPSKVKVSQAARNLISGVLEPSVEKRWTMDMVLSSVWMKNVPYFYASTRAEAAVIDRKIKDCEREAAKPAGGSSTFSKQPTTGKGVSENKKVTSPQIEKIPHPTKKSTKAPSGKADKKANRAPGTHSPFTTRIRKMLKKQ